MRGKQFCAKSRKGFTLVELTVVIVIIGVLAAFGIPRMLKSVERSKASEAFSYCGAIRAAQERYQGRQGTYTAVIGDLDIQMPAPGNYSVGTLATGGSGSLEDSWTLTLTRSGVAGGYGNYTVVFTEEGYDSATSTIIAEIDPMGT